MAQVIARFTVFFEDPFWVGVYERETDGAVQACRVVFGPEPKDYTVYAFLLENWHRLSFGPPVAGGAPDRGSNRSRVNPKRLQRQVKTQTAGAGVGTKAQQALKLQQQEGKAARRTLSRQQREQCRQQLFDQQQQKKKEKHRGH